MAFLLHAVVGFIAPHLGSIINTAKVVLLSRMDKEKAERVAQLELQRLIQTPTEPSGAKFLSALESSKFSLPKFWVGFILLLYTALDWISTTVRPGITWVMIAAWVTYGLTNSWTEQDQNMLIMILAYWFSDLTLHRQKK